MNTQKIYTELRTTEQQIKLNTSYITEQINFYNYLKALKELNEINEISETDINIITDEIINKDTETETLKIKVDELRHALNKSYVVNSFQTENLNTYKKVIFNKLYNEYEILSNTQTIKNLSIKQLLKIFLHKKNINYFEYKNALYRIQNKDKILNDNTDKQTLKELIIKHKDFLINKYGIDIKEELKSIQYKNVFCQKIQNLLNSYYKIIKTHNSKNTQSYLKKVENTRNAHMTHINAQPLHFRLKKDYSQLINKCYTIHATNTLKALLNNSLLNDESIRKHANDTTIINTTE